MHICPRCERSLYDGITTCIAYCYYCGLYCTVPTLKCKKCLLILKCLSTPRAVNIDGRHSRHV